MKLDPYPKITGNPDQVLRKVSDLFREHAQQVNQISEGLITGAYAARTSVPTTGTWKQGDFVRKSDTTEAGSTGSEYVILGWIRITNGSNNVLNTDWVEVRAPTGTFGVGAGGSSVDNTVPRFVGTSGAEIEDTGVLIGDSDEISGYKAHLNIQTGTTYTLVASDTGKIVDHSNASAITVTLPNSLAVGFAVTYVQTGAGQITFSPASGASLRNRQSHTKTAGQWGVVILYVRTNSGGSAAEYVLGGDTAA